MNCYWSQFAEFTEEQFAANEYFQQWVLIPDEENEAFWQGFINNYPNQKVAVANARKLVEHLVETGFHMPNLTPQEKQDLKYDIFSKIQPAEDDNEESRHIKKSPKKTWLAAAAFIGFAALSAVILSRTGKTFPAAYHVHTTAPKQVKEILLPDSSLVVLNGNSSIQYAPGFSTTAQREVILTGNAYFRIRKSDKGAPFIVHANQINIQVTGTEFNVDARSAATDVVLTKGNINISLAKDAGNNHKTHLKAGEKFRLDTLKREYITEKTNTELYTAAWENGEWHFDGTTLEQVGNLITQFYGTKVLFKNKNAQSLMITAVVSVKDLSTLVHVIEKTLNLAIEETPDQIVIN